MPLLILVIGIPGAGKTTWCNQYLKTHGATLYISNDDLRKELTGTEDFNSDNKDLIYEEARKRAVDALAQNRDVIVDGTHTDVNQWIKFKRAIPDDCLIAAKVFAVPPDTAIEHIEKRERKVPMYVLENKWRELSRNLKFLPFIFNFIFDDKPTYLTSPI